VRIAGVRISAPAARLLADVLRTAGSGETSDKIATAIELRVTTEAPLTVADHEAILEALADYCPADLGRLRRVLLEEQRHRRLRP
jgi:hypothetical protein